MHRYADENQYLEINRRTGPRICLPGPAQIFENPVEHESVKVKKAVLVSANQALVVYKPSSAGGKGQEEMIKDIGDTFQLKQWMLSLFLTMHFNLVTDPPQVRYSKLTETRLPLLIKQR